jgi:hypothetical protein
MNIYPNVYQENGYKSRKDYLTSLAAEYGVDYQSVACLAALLGSGEDFDALVSAVEDIAMAQENEEMM